MNRIEPTSNEISDLPEVVEDRRDLKYVTPEASLDYGAHAKPSLIGSLIFIAGLQVFSGTVLFLEETSIITKTNSSLCMLVYAIATFSGMIWWLIGDSRIFGYSLNSVKVILITLLGPIGILIYSFFTRGLLKGAFLVVKFILFVMLLGLINAGVFYLCGSVLNQQLL